LIGKRNQSIQISTGATLKLQGNETNDWTSPSYTQTLTYDDQVISLFSDTGLHTSSLRYWSLFIEDKKNPNGNIEVGSFYLGNFWNQTRGRVQFPLRSQPVDRSETIFSEGGQTYSDVREKTNIYNVEWLGLQKADIETFEEDIWAVYGTSRPFFVSMDGDEAFSTNKNKRIIFCKFDDEPNWDLSSPDNFIMSMSLREEL